MARDREGSDDSGADRYADRIDKLSDDRRRLLEALLADREAHHRAARPPFEPAPEPTHAAPSPAPSAPASNGRASYGRSPNGPAPAPQPQNGYSRSREPQNGHAPNGSAPSGPPPNGHAHSSPPQNGYARRPSGARPGPRNPFSAGHGSFGAQNIANPFGDGGPFGNLHGANPFSGGGLLNGLLQHLMGRLGGVSVNGFAEDGSSSPWAAAGARGPRTGGPVRNPWSHAPGGAYRTPPSRSPYPDHDGAPPFSPLVAMKPTGRKTPFFCVHALLGSAFPYHHLAVHVDREQPMYGLQARGLDGLHEPLSRVEDMAACYLEAIRIAQPEGPYHLGGYSFGGWVAFEMARLLSEQGEQIASLSMFGTLAPSVAVRGAVAPFAEMALGYLEDLQRLVTRSSLAGRGGSLNPQQRVVLANCMAALRYLPRPQPVSLDLFVTADQRLLCQIDPSLGWGTLCEGPIETYAVPGNHLSMFQEPHVRDLARQLATCLSREAHRE
ncbi:putative non-ribosomal peptide synthetase [Minicystis rosea]|nr:putative non-ribosomal peptide synthetase [Minicystis rosea]